MKYNVFLLFLGTTLLLIHFFTCAFTTESVMLPTGALALITFVPVKEPCPIAWPGTLYSASWSIAGLTRMALKNVFSFFIRWVELGVVPHFVPQKIVNTSTLGISGPPR